MDLETRKALEETIRRDHGNVTGIVVRKNGVKLYEGYFHGYTPEDQLHVFSVTKSVFSALIGIALDQGCIQSIDQRVLEFFPDYAPPEGEETVQRITLRHLLTMTAPYKYEEEPYEAFFSSEDWTRFALDQLGGAGRIGDFLYAGIVGSHLLSGILVKATGRSVLDFARAHLFGPLDIQVPGPVPLRTQEEHIAAMNSKGTRGWAVDPQGVSPAGWGLFLSPADMASIGQLYLNGGVWNGKRILPQAWIDASTREQSRWPELSLPYGYLWWVIDPQEHAYAAMGDGGNVIYVNTERGLVISIAALFQPEAADRIALIRGVIEPMVEER